MTAIKRPVSGGARRAIAGMRSVGPADLVHGLDVDLPLRPAAPTVTTVHDLSVLDVPWAFPRHRVIGERLLIERAIRRADALIAVSEFTAERIAHHFGRSATVIHLAPPPLTEVSDDDVERVRHDYDLPSRFVLQLASIEPRKDPAALARAAALHGIPVVLAGGIGPSSTVPPGTRHLGYIPLTDVGPLLTAADIVGYLSSYEGFGLPPIEAMALGRPVIASAVGALPDVVGDGARLVPPGDEPALGEALANLWFDRDEREELGRRGAKQAALLDWSATAAATLAVYRQLGVAC